MVFHDAILLGGGVGTRYNETASPSEGQNIPKQFLLLNDVPVFIHALKALNSLGCFRQFVVVVPAPLIPFAKNQIAEFFSSEFSSKASTPPVRVIEGGERRQDSSRLAIEALAESEIAPTRILIHDACRPFLSLSLLERIHHCLLDRSYGAWVPVVPVVETLKKIENSKVVETVDRGLYQRVQTPQIFEFSLIQPLMEKVKVLSELTFTDDASLCEYFGIPVGVFPGDLRNLKLTYDFESDVLKNILAENSLLSAEKDSKPCELASDMIPTV